MCASAGCVTSPPARPMCGCVYVETAAAGSSPKQDHQTGVGGWQLRHASGVSTTGAPLVERFARIVDEAGWDLHLRVEGHDVRHVATLVEPEPRSGHLDDPRWGPALGRPPGLLEPEVLNSNRFRRTPFPAIALHASALSLATFYDELTGSDGFVTNRLGHDLWQTYVQPAATGHDLVLDRSVTWTSASRSIRPPAPRGGPVLRRRSSCGYALPPARRRCQPRRREAQARADAISDARRPRVGNQGAHVPALRTRSSRSATTEHGIRPADARSTMRPCATPW